MSAPCRGSAASFPKTSSNSPTHHYKQGFRGETCRFYLESLILRRHEIMLPPASTQGICPHQHHTGFFLSQLLIFKGNRRTNYLINLKVRGILFSDVLIRLLTSRKGYQLMQEHGQMWSCPFRGRSRAAGFQRRPCRKPPGSQDLCNLKSARHTCHGIFHRLYQRFPIYK